MQKLKWEHSRTYRKILPLFLMAAIAAAIIFWDSAAPDPNSADDLAQAANASEGSGLSVRIHNGLKIDWWKNEQDARFYLFLPGAVAGEKLELTYPGAGTILIDGKTVQNGGRCRLKEGAHTLTVDGSPYDLTVMYTSDIAALFFETDSGTLDGMHASKEHSESGSMILMDSRGHTYFEGTIEDIHCRGNSSFDDTDKKSYLIKLDKKADLFGMGAAKKWILTANAFDDTLLRNTTAFSIAKLLKLAHTPDAQYVDVYANGQYLGNYILCERPEVGKNRVDVRDLEKEVEEMNEGIDLGTTEFFMEQQGRLFSTKGYRIENEPDDISGGYLLELETSDRYGLEASGFLTSRMQPVVFASPKYASYDQVSYIAGRYQDLEDAAFSPDGISPYTQRAYSDYIDMDSFARKYLLEELVKNLDASFTSQYIYKYDDSISDLFFAGPCWDYDKSIAAYGVTDDGIDLHDPKGLYAAVQEKDSDIWYALYQHADFRQTAAAIFFQELEPQLRASAHDILYQNKALIEKSNDCNMTRWNTFPEATDLARKQEIYSQKVEELDVFLDQRLDFLAEEWESEQDE